MNDSRRFRKPLAVIAVLLVLALAVSLAVRRWRSSDGAKAAPGGAAAAGPEAQTVSAFDVEKTTFTDVVDGLIGTVKGGAIELTYGGTEERLTAVHVKLGQTVKKGELLFELDHVRAAARKAQAEIAYDRAVKLEEAGGATSQEVREAQAALDIALRDWEDTFIRAPKRGTLSEIKKQAGETVGRNDSLAVIVSREDDLFLETGVIEGQLNRVAAGQKAVIEIEALGGRSLEGIILGVSREVTTTGRTGAVQISLPDDVQSTLRPGLSARCRIVTFDGQALVIPRQSFDADAGGVYVIAGDKARFQKVALGHITPDWYEVKEGLTPGDRIVRDLIVNPVQDGTPLTVSGEPETYQPEER